MRYDYEVWGNVKEKGSENLYFRSYFDDAVETAESYWKNGWYHIRVYDTVNKFDVWEDGEYLL